MANATAIIVRHTQPLQLRGRNRKDTVLNELTRWIGGIAGGNVAVAGIDIYPDDNEDAAAASGTVTLATCLADTVVEVNGVPFTAIGSGTAVAANNEFLISGTDTADATALAAAINNSTHVSIKDILTATSSVGAVTVSADMKGSLGNGVTIKTLGVVASGTVTYSSASGAQTCTINGTAVTAPTGATDAALATSLAASINGAAGAIHTGHVRALARAGVCHVFAKYPGAQGNAITLAVTGTGATASGARLTGGAEASSGGAAASGTVTVSSGSGAITVTVNGVEVASETWATSDAATVAALLVDCNAITNALVHGLVKFTASTNVLTVTALRGGVSGNAITLATTGTGSTASGARLTAGAVPTTVALSGDRLASGTAFNVGVTSVA